MTSESSDVPVAWKPHGYQKRAIRFAVERGAAGLLMDPGLGKTAVTLATLKILREKRLVRRALVIAPLRVVYEVWPFEAAKWYDFVGTVVRVAHGPQKVEAIYDPRADVVVMNYEGLKWFESLKPVPDFDVLILDESTKVKHASTQRFKILRRMLGRFRRRYILTGTPAPNGLLDLFGQIFVLDQGHALGPYITHYRNRWFYPTGYGGYEWRIRDDRAVAEIYEAIKPLVIRLDEKDYLELPERIDVTIPVSLPDSARKIYDDLEDDFVAELTSGKIVAMNAAAATSKIRQVANGGIYHSDDVVPELSAKRPWTPIHDEKTNAVVNLIDELSGQPALIAYDTHHDLARLKKALGNPPHIGGGVSSRDASTIVRDWNAGKIPALLVQPASVAHGLNLQHGGRAVIWHSLTWDLEAYDQLIRRVWRQGQRDRVFVYHVVARRTIDETIMTRLASKTRTQQGLLNALRSRYDRRRNPRKVT